jgi:hypothetical protein
MARIQLKRAMSDLRANRHDIDGPHIARTLKLLNRPAELRQFLESTAKDVLLELKLDRARLVAVGSPASVESR